jgi:hypothetical protein
MSELLGLVRCVVKAEAQSESIAAKSPKKVMFGSISKLTSELPSGAVKTTVQDHSYFDLVYIRPY